MSGGTGGRRPRAAPTAPSEGVQLAPRGGAATRRSGISKWHNAAGPRPRLHGVSTLRRRRGPFPSRSRLQRRNEGDARGPTRQDGGTRATPAVRRDKMVERGRMPTPRESTGVVSRRSRGRGPAYACLASASRQSSASTGVKFALSFWPPTTMVRCVNASASSSWPTPNAAAHSEHASSVCSATVDVRLLPPRPSFPRLPADD